MHVALTKARTRDADEFSLLVEFTEVFGANISTGGTQTSGELVQNSRCSALVGHLTFDAFRYQFESVLDVLLEIAIGGTARHRTDRSHAAIGLVRTSLVEEQLTGSFVGARKQRADHCAICAGGHRFRQVA